MKSFAITLLAIALAPSIARADTLLANAHYRGSGHWIDQLGNQGDYSIDVTVDGQKAVSNYTSPGQELTYSSTWQPTGQGNFLVYLDGVAAPVGAGICASKVCSYEMPLIYKTSETWTFFDNGVTKTGYRLVSGLWYKWEELLTLVQ